MCEREKIEERREKREESEEVERRQKSERGERERGWNKKVNSCYKSLKKLDFGTSNEVWFLIFDVPNVKNLIFGTPNANVLTEAYSLIVKIKTIFYWLLLSLL